MKTRIEAWYHDERAILVFWPGSPDELAAINTMRDIFEENGYRTDRVWSDKQMDAGQPLGIRVYVDLHKFAERS